MFNVAIALLCAGLCVAVYLMIKILSKRDQRGRARWRSLITPTPIDAFPVHDRTERIAPKGTLAKRD
jgi:hypothetical protein